jgi:hypothetical protein
MARHFLYSFYKDDVHITSVLNVIPVVSREIHHSSVSPMGLETARHTSETIEHRILLPNNLAQQWYSYTSVQLERQEFAVVHSVTSVYCVGHISRVFFYRLFTL